MRAIAGTLLTILSSAAAQTPDPSPQFEVASVKLSQLGSGPFRMGSRGGPGTKDPGLFTCENCGIPMLIRQAFELQDYQLSDQVWMRSARFNVSAKIPESATREQFHLMLRNLLTERFNLKFHYEKKEMEAYQLAAAKNGPKMKESATALDSAPLSSEFKMDADGFPILPISRELALMRTADGHTTMRQAETTMEEFAIILTQQLGRPVTDATGLKGKYDFTLKWIEQKAGAPADDTGPDLFRALQAQLGLKLESKKSPVEVFVIDHIEKTPTEN